VFNSPLTLFGCARFNDGKYGSNGVNLPCVALDRAQVVKAAIALLDEAGLAALSLRRLAQRLGVQAPALYWHFKNKQELLDTMAATIASEEVPLLPPTPRIPWDEWLAAYARLLRAAYSRHRDGALLAASTQPAPSQWRDIELRLRVLSTAGLSPADGMRALIAIGNYVTGFTLEEQLHAAAADTGTLTYAQYGEARARLAGFPRLAEAMREIGDPQGADAFEGGLQTILDGVRARARR
jgi:TetR/AcrR family transcriptional regulator, tetracycline repressor protein